MDLVDKIKRLPFASAALHNSAHESNEPRCLEGTRVQILHQIKDWATDQNSKTVFWLQGKAGEGKSTIARTVADMLSAESLLGASFFLKRNEPDRNNLSNFFPTLARQLSNAHKGTARFINEFLENSPGGHDVSLAVQFEKLVLRPLAKAYEAAPEMPVVVVVIDALDECDSKSSQRVGEDLKQVIRLLTGAKGSGMKAFVTSRPYHHIQFGFKSQGQENHQDLDLHRVPQDDIHHDISRFLGLELRHIGNKWISRTADDRLPHVWPSPDAVRDLVALSLPLFIFAATLCRFIDQRF